MSVVVASADPRTAAIDVETYGCIQGREQTTFSPPLFPHADGVPHRQAGVVMGVTQIHGDLLAGGGEPGETMTMRLDTPEGRSEARGWLLHCDVLVGSNLAFDMACLTLCLELSPRQALGRELVDTTWLGYLDDPSLGSYGLKELCAHHGLGTWPSTVAGGMRFAGPHDPRLPHYVARDSHRNASLACHLARLCRRFPWQPRLWSGATRTAACMNLEGVPLNLVRLDSMRRTMESVSEAISRRMDRKGIILEGEGSATTQRSFMHSLCQEAHDLDDPSLEWTAKTRRLRFCLANMALLGDEGSIEIGRWLDDWNAAQASVAQAKAATAPGLLATGGAAARVHPTWYASPSPASHGQSGAPMGRISSRKPNVQGWTAPMLSCIGERGRTFLEADLVAADLCSAIVLSGDARMAQAAASECHVESSPYAVLVAGAVRTAGMAKTAALRLLNGAGDPVIRQALAQRGDVVPLGAIARWREEIRARWPAFFAWTDSVPASLARGLETRMVPTGVALPRGSTVQQALNFQVASATGARMQWLQLHMLDAGLGHGPVRIHAQRHDGFIVSCACDPDEEHALAQAMSAAHRRSALDWTAALGHPPDDHRFSGLCRMRLRPVGCHGLMTE